MTRRTTLALAFAGIIALILALGFFRRPGVTYHTRAWHRAARLAMGGNLPWHERIVGALISKHPQQWWDKAKYHEAELLKLGYLTNCTFQLTNQVMTRPFSTHFFQTIYRRLGTNEDQVWRCPHLPNEAGYSPTFPVKDYAIWEQTFRECAARYASNVPPESTHTTLPRPFSQR